MDPIIYKIKESTIKSTYLALVDAVDRLNTGTSLMEMCMRELEEQHPNLKELKTLCGFS